MKNITLERVVRTLLGVLTTGVVIVILYNYITLVAFLILAMILSYVLDPTVNRLQRMGVYRTLGITLTLSVMLWPLYSSQRMLFLYCRRNAYTYK